MTSDDRLLRPSNGYVSYPLPLEVSTLTLSLPLLLVVRSPVSAPIITGHRT